MVGPYFSFFTNSLPHSPSWVGHCIRMDSWILNREDKNAFCLPLDERSDSLSLERRAKDRGVAKTEDRALITHPDLGKGPKLNNSALLLSPARDHSDRPRSKTSKRLRKLHSLFCCHQTSATLDKALLCLCWHLALTGALCKQRCSQCPSSDGSVAQEQWQPWLWQGGAAALPVGRTLGPDRPQCQLRLRRALADLCKHLGHEPPPRQLSPNPH